MKQYLQFPIESDGTNERKEKERRFNRNLVATENRKAEFRYGKNEDLTKMKSCRNNTKEKSQIIPPYNKYLQQQTHKTSC